MFYELQADKSYLINGVADQVCYLEPASDCLLVKKCETDFLLLLFLLLAIQLLYGKCPKILSRQFTLSISITDEKW